MLTLKQINESSFRKSSFSGYKPEDVDKFIDEVSETVKALIRENQAYKAKLQELNVKNIELNNKNVQLAESLKSSTAKLSTVRDDEDTIKNIIINAQKLSSITMKEAKDKADEIVADANYKADTMITEAKLKSSEIIHDYDVSISAKEKEFAIIKEKVTDFRSALFEMYRAHLTSVESIPDFSEEIKEIKAKQIEKPVKIVDEIEENTIQIEEIPVEVPVKEETPVKVEEKVEMLDIDSGISDEIADLDMEKEINPFDEIDFDTFSDIPEALKNEKASKFNTLEFGADINLGIKK